MTGEHTALPIILIWSRRVPCLNRVSFGIPMAFRNSGTCSILMTWPSRVGLTSAKRSSVVMVRSGLERACQPPAWSEQVNRANICHRMIIPRELWNVTRKSGNTRGSHDIWCEEGSRANGLLIISLHFQVIGGCTPKILSLTWLGWPGLNISGYNLATHHLPEN